MISALLAIDQSVFLFLNQALANPVFDWIMPLFDKPAYWVLPLLIFWIFLLVRDRDHRLRLGILIPLVVFLSDQSGGLIKDLELRDRPWFGLETEEVRHLGGTGGKHKSFPSNHAANITGIALIFGACYRRQRWTLTGIAVLIAYSRIYIGVHYPLDVISGAALGGLWGSILNLGWNSWFNHQRKSTAEVSANMN